MCTILLATRCWPERPLVLAANRDEFLARPAEGPRVRELADLPGQPVWSPLDRKAGGTWMGMNRHGLVVAITNRASAPPDPELRSRGALVAQALGHADLEAAGAWARSVEVRDYNPFHLVVASAQGAFELWRDGAARRWVELGPGLHVITERDAGLAAGAGAQARPSTRPQLARELTAGWAEAARAPEPEAWMRVLGHRPATGDPMDALTVRIEGAPYGTRSASVLELDAAGGVASFSWAEGAPDQRPFVDESAPLRAWLEAAPAVRSGEASAKVRP